MTTRNVLVIGSGGREHALAWALARSPHVGRIFVAPGNAGTAWAEHAGSDGGRIAPSSNMDIKSDDIPALAAFARDTQIDLTVVGPEAPLAAGIVDAFQKLGLRIFGPTQEAAQLESSKAFAKDFMREHGIPTADYHVFSDFEAASEAVKTLDRPVVVKADGLAAGKGVILCDMPDEAQAALHYIMIDRAFGAAGDRVIIEERLEGWEVSVLAFTDGKTFAVMPYAADHKRAYDDDQGPNTGGMGAYAPALAGMGGLESFAKSVEERVLRPTIEGMAARGTPYVGVLYAGLMVTPEGPHVLEFNCRFGDPETQVILPLLASNLYDVLSACASGRLKEIDVRWQDGACVGVVMASGGYPEAYQTGYPITGLSEADALDGVQVFHAGTALREGQVVTSGGRVLVASATGETHAEAAKRAYSTVDLIHFDKAHFRRDIGARLRGGVDVKQ